MKIDITDTQFVKSIAQPHQMIDHKGSEIAFAGRSNVGKSSLLNAITGKKKLAKISNRPGKTRTINVFSVNGQHYFVDLPGYGFARVSKAEKEHWRALIEGYIIDNPKLKLICLLIDIRHKLQDNDRQMIEWLTFERIPFIIVLTKADKLSGNLMHKQVSYYRNLFPDHHIQPFSIRKPAFIQKLSDRIIQSFQNAV